MEDIMINYSNDTNSKMVTSMDTTSQSMMQEDFVATDNGVASSNGNMHILIICVVIFAIIGVALGIWSGKKSANK